MTTQNNNRLISKSENRRIAKNTLFLYFRMGLIMIVQFYMSRIVLEILGVDDYGIYNLIGGVVILFTFLSTTMTTASQRYLCALIGKNESISIQEMFSSSLVAHLLLMAIALIIAETLGLWFIKTKLVIPEDRVSVALIVYQLTVLTTLVNIYKIPFNAAVLSYEKMSFFSYTGIVEALLKLIILWPLSVIKADKLILYVVLVLIINIIILIWYMAYVHIKLDFVKHKLDKSTRLWVKKIFRFAGWSSLSACANVGSKQGLNFLINIFYGVALNATVGIMNQVAVTIYQFIGNFQSAVTPPMIKNYSSRNFEQVYKLLVISSKASFYLLAILITPVIFNIDIILKFWLREVPPLTSFFCIFALVALLPNTIGGPVWTIVQAQGNIKKYQMIISVILLLNIPAYYLVFESNLMPQYAVAVQFVTNFIVVLVGVKMKLDILSLNLLSYSKEIVFPCFLTLILAWATVYIFEGYFSFINCSSNFICLILKCIVDVGIVIIAIWSIGLNTNQRHLIKNLLRFKVNGHDFHNNSRLQ